MTVYFLQKDPPSGPVKIGWARRSARRRLQLSRTFAETSVVLLGEAAGDRALEARLHRRFAADRMTGEWFRPSAQVLEAAHAASEGLDLRAWLDA